MRTRLSIVCLLLCAQTLSAQDVNAPAKRTVSLDLARTLLTTHPLKLSPDELEKKNPFNPEANMPKTAIAVPVVTSVTVADRDRLAQLAAQLAPTGSVQLGDVSYLLFGQKKFKVGDSLPIGFQGATYELVITAIERTNFSLRLNNEEITRPIKPVVTKP